MRGQDAFGRPQRIKAYDYLARIFQHEIDHLDGVLFIDKADPGHDPQAHAQRKPLRPPAKLPKRPH